MDEGNRTKYNVEMQNNLDKKNEGRKKDDIEKKAYIERRVFYEQEIPCGKRSSKKSIEVYECFHINEWHLHDCLE